MAVARTQQDQRTGRSKHTHLRGGLTSAQFGITRVALYRSLPAVLDALGSDADSILESQGLARADFEGSENQMPYLQLERLLVECERQTGCDHFGLLVCENSRLDDFGLPGRIARCAGTVGEALEAFASIYNLHRGAGIIDVIDTGAIARFVFAIAMPGSRDTRQYQIGAMAIAFNLLEDLCGPSWQATEVRLALRSPPSARPYLRFFRAPVRFDADESAIEFGSEWLSRELPPVAEPARRSVAAEARRVRERAFDDFSGLVRDVIRKQLSSGRSSIETVAAMLSMHPRSLERRLAQDGESYSSLRQMVKREVAVRLLRETELSVQEIADFLRFSSAANFATAFRRWTDRTPMQFRTAES